MGSSRPRLTWREVCARRLDRHRLLTRAPRESLVEVVRAINGVHAQIQTAAD